MEDIPFFSSESNLFNKLSIPPCSSKYFISPKLSILSLYNSIIWVNSFGVILKIFLGSDILSSGYVSSVIIEIFPKFLFSSLRFPYFFSLIEVIIIIIFYI